ncbi:MAG: M56 family metallopeptidase, partial [Bryobacteraceae bacterium]
MWVSAMGFTIAATLFAMVAPQPVEEVVIDRAVTTSNLLTYATAQSPLMTSEPAAAAADRVLAVSDSLLPAGWLISSLVLLVALVIGQRRFRVERRAARSAIVGGHDVLLTENLGPAVAGVRRPVVFVPRWVLALDDGSQRLLLAHEAEHVKERDTSLLLFGAVTAALTPWNPVVWWMVRRLRLAVEQDCDARVLATHPGVRRYADLLLTAASRHGLTARLLAAHFGEHTSDLVRRIEAMTSRKRIPWRTLVGATFIAATLVAVACEAPRPDPVAPLAVREAAAIQVPGESVKRSKEYSEQVARCSREGGEGCQISVIVQSSEGLELKRYAGEIPVARLTEGSVGKIKIEEGPCGTNSCSLIWITLKPGRSIPKSAYRARTPEQKGEAIDEVVKLRRAEKMYSRIFVPSPSKDGEVEVATATPSGELISARIIERDANRVVEGTGYVEWPKARIELRNKHRPAEMPNVLILNSAGTEVKR